MGAFVNPGERTGREKCQRQDHRFVLPELLILPTADPLVGCFAKLIKQGDADRGTARPVSRLARFLFRFLFARQCDNLASGDFRVVLRRSRLVCVMTYLICPTEAETIS